MRPKDAEGTANSVDPDQICSSRSSLILVCTVCPDLSVWKFKIKTVTLGQQYDTYLPQIHVYDKFLSPPLK